MSVLITGGAGYIGSHITWALVALGVEVVVLDDLSTGHADALPEAAVFTEGDINDGALVKALVRRHGVTAALHLAGKSVVADSFADPLGYYRANTVKTAALLDALADAGARHVVFSSTAAVYAGHGRRTVDETAATTPGSPYGRSKLLAEAHVRETARARGLGCAILRYFNVAGADPALPTPRADRSTSHLITAAVETAVGKRNRLRIFGADYDTRDGTCVRDYIHVSDLVDAHLAVLHRLQAGGRDLLYNCGSGQGATVLEVIRAVERRSGRTLAVEMMPRRSGDAPQLVADIDRIRRDLRWSPRRGTLDRIVGDALAWEARSRMPASVRGSHAPSRRPLGQG